MTPLRHGYGIVGRGGVALPVTSAAMESAAPAMEAAGETTAMEAARETAAMAPAA